MYLKRGADFPRTVTFRLTLWYTLVFGGLALMVFLIVYLSLTLYLREQMDRALLSKVNEFGALYDSHGIEALRSEFHRETQSEGENNVFCRLLSSDGRKIVSSNLKPWQGLITLKSPPSGVTRREPVFRSLNLPGVNHRTRVITGLTGDGHIIEVGITSRANEIMMKKYRETFGTALVIMLICGGLVGWLLARKAMAGVRRVTRTATQIGKRNLARRVPPGNEGEEINALACAFNEMLERIESLVRELKQVTDNVAHELRTPITRIRGIAETTLNSSADRNEFREMAASVIEGSDRIIEMINTMLEITRTDSGVAELVRTSLDLREIIREAVDLFKPLAEDKNIALQLEIPPGDILFSGDRSRIQRAVANLIDNAIKYTSSGGLVKVSARSHPTGIKVIIADTGPAIDEKDISHIFDRFYRGDESRSTPGSGLGLSLALTLIRAHGGDIFVKSSPGRGNTFTITLPGPPLPS